LSIYSLMVVTQDRQKISRRGKSGTFQMKKCPSVSFFSLLLFFLLLALGFPGETLFHSARGKSYKQGEVLQASVEPFRTGLEAVKEIPPTYPFLIYTVERGDTISLVAARFSLNPLTLVSLNKLSRPEDLRGGMKIYIPGEDGTRRTLPEGINRSEWALSYSLSEKELIPLGENEYFLPRTELSHEEADLFWRDNFSYPLAADIRGSYGKRYDELTGLSREREGIEFEAYKGQNVYSIGKGVVTKTGFHGTFGRYMIVNHSNDFQSLYAHLDQFLKKEGDSLDRGDVLARAGNSGHTPGNTLYFSLFKEGKTVNPQDYLY
jgi:murein DD-endopeptidase MepM/ murein hydrolase activator NlpD